jgi:magnesium transporter
MLTNYYLSENRIVECSEEQSQIRVYINPDETEKRILVDKFNLDEHTLNSSLDPDEQSRLEFEEDHIAIIAKIPKNYSAENQFFFKVGSMGIFWFKNKLIIVSSEEITLFEGKQFQRVWSLNDVLLKIIYRKIYHFFDHLRIINMVSDDLEHKINESMGNKYLINMFTLEKSLVYYLNAINSNEVVIQKIRNFSNKFDFSEDEHEFLEDIIIDNNQCLKQARMYSDILASMMDARVSIVSNNLNILMKTLNIITISIMVPTFVVSAFSMNVGIPLSGHPYAFWIILGLALISVISSMIFFRYKKW